jgi:hypothetical protein
MTDNRPFTKTKEGKETMEPRTQKAKGLVALKANPDQLMFGGRVQTLPFKLIGEESDIDDPLFYIKEELFARPCPVDPQHGFVDSRPIKDKQEAKKLFRKAQKKDPKAEMLLMPYIKADFNAIWTPGLLSVGPGNDGATGGHKSIALRTTDQVPLCDAGKLVKAAGVKDGAAPYLEFVGCHPAAAAQHETLYLVQLRGGPKVGSLGPDYNPKTIKVQHVVHAKGDLIEWKNMCEKFKAGTVVVHPGGTMSSHYAVHCVEHDIPIFTSGLIPKVGETLKEIPVKKPEKDVEEVLKGLAMGVTFPVDYESAVLIVLGALHNSLFMDKTDSRLFGVAVMLALKLGFAACFGEARHKEKHGLARHQVYDKAWADIASHVKRFNETRVKFYNKKWSPGFGGKAWGHCADATADLWNATVRLVRHKTKENLTAVVDALNVVINQAHNNGWWFNKFIAASWFNVAANSPASPLIVAMRHIYKIMTAPAKLEGLVADIEKAGESEDASASPRRAKAVVNKPTEDNPADYGPFKIVHVPSGKPWFVYYPDGKRVRCAGLWGVAKLYLLHHNTEVSDENRKAVVKHIESQLGKTKGGGKKKDTWIIPAIAKTDLQDKVTAAVGTIKGEFVHVQMQIAGADKHETKNVGTSAQVSAILEKALKQKSIPSFSGSGAPYVPLDVKPDGIYVGDHKLLALKKQCL